MSFGGIKRTPADIVFSKCIRESHDYNCERCNKNLRHDPKVMDNSHYYGRGNKSTRLAVENCSCLCRGCHNYLGEHPYEHTQFMQNKLGEARMELLVEKAREIFKLGKPLIKEATAHYKLQLEILEARRAEGEVGYLPFESWQ